MKPIKLYYFILSSKMNRILMTTKTEIQMLLIVVIKFVNKKKMKKK